jgi:hypothetical protein
VSAAQDWFIPEGNHYVTVDEDTPCGVCGCTIPAGRQGIYDNHGRLCGYSCDCDLGTPSALDKALDEAWEERCRAIEKFWRKNKNLREALTGMALRAAYWRWAYRDAQRRAILFEFMFDINTRALENYRRRASAAEDDNRRLRAELALIAKEPCRARTLTGLTCAELGRSEAAPCSSCRARRAVHPDSRIRP